MVELQLLLNGPLQTRNFFLGGGVEIQDGFQHMI
jgi:hypothetical protein